MLRVRRLVPVAVVVAVLGAVLILVLTGGGDDGRVAPTPTTTESRALRFSLPLGQVSVESAGPVPALSAEQAQQVLATVVRYVNVATVAPLRSGKPVEDLSTVLGPAALARLTGPDRAVLVDEGLPRVRGALTVTGAPLDIVGLGDQAGNLLLVAAKLDLAVQGVTDARGPAVTVTRRGQLVLAADAGGWKIVGYDLEVARSGAGVDSVTTSSTPPTSRR